MVLEVVVFVVAGIITGIVAGVVGASAIVAFIPLILIFFDYDPFTIIGISLVLDIFIALPALYNYLRYKHVNLKIGIYIAVPAMFGAVIGSYFSSNISGSDLLGVTALFISFAGITIFRRKTTHKSSQFFSKIFSKRNFKGIIVMILSLIIGFLGGTVGAAGGLSVLFLFLFIFGFETHEAVGTSLFVMFFIALFGATAHFYYLDRMHFSWLLLGLSIMGGIFGSLLSSKIANKIPEKTLNKIVGSILIILGITTFAHKVLF